MRLTVTLMPRYAAICAVIGPDTIALNSFWKRVVQRTDEHRGKPDARSMLASYIEGPALELVFEVCRSQL